MFLMLNQRVKSLARRHQQLSSNMLVLDKLHQWSILIAARVLVHQNCKLNQRLPCFSKTNRP